MLTKNARVLFVAPALPLVLLGLACAPQALAQLEQAQSEQAQFEQEHYEVEQDSPVWLRALVDVRVARGPSAPSWTDGGPVKTRFGGKRTNTGSERSTQLLLAQLAIEIGATLPWDIRAQAQLNVQPDLADDNEPWLVEALLRREWGLPENGWGLQAGLMNVPFSLEHIGPAWSPAYTISASALNSWMWEEISLAGLEGEWWHVSSNGLRIGLLVGAGFGADRLGRLIALRGWAMGDGLSGVNADLPLFSGARNEIFYEKDNKPAGYAWLSLADREERVTVRIGHFDNFADQSIGGSWNTHFSTIGATLHPLPGLDVVAQYLRGEAKVRDTTNDSALRAYYGLVSWHRARHRVSFRYDSFRVDDTDGGSSTSEWGRARTAAYFCEIGLRHRLGFEYVWLDSVRPGSAVPEPFQDGWQLSYRFRY